MTKKPVRYGLINGLFPAMWREDGRVYVLCNGRWRVWQILTIAPSETVYPLPRARFIKILFESRQCARAAKLLTQRRERSAALWAMCKPSRGHLPDLPALPKG